MTDSFELNDAVLVNQEGRKLEGVIAWRGSWATAPDDGDWVGVRLTGASAGLGATDGTVDGTEYFSCPPNCGVFAPVSALIKRRLTRLEELRLKRELAGSGKKATTAGATGTRSASATPTTPTTTHQKTPHATAGKDAKASPAPAATRVEGKTGLSKLEELRQRRAALNEKKDTVKATLSTPSPAGKVAAPAAGLATNDPIASLAPAFEKEDIRKLNEKLEPLHQQLASLQARLGDKETEVASLRSKLSAKDLELEETRTMLEQATTPVAAASARSDSHLTELEGKLRATERELQETQTKLEQSLKAAVAGGPAVVVSRATDDSFERLAALESSLHEWKEKAHDALLEVTNLKHLLEQEKESHDASKVALTAARADLAHTSKELEILTNQMELRGTTDNSHYKERAKLQAEISSQKRKVESLEKEKMEMEATIEDLALDKEQLLQDKELLEDRCDELRLDAETAQLAVEELKMELEDVRRVSSEVAGASQVENLSDAEEKAAALSAQNARLREALIRLREQSQVKDMEQMRQIRAAEKEVESAKALTDEVQKLRATKAFYEDQISELKDVVEQGSSFEQMVEDLSDKLLSIEEENSSLRSVLREMEEAAELSAEVEEVQADELKALNRDLEGRDSVIHNLEEAIKIQRRREEDFLRSVANYRTTVATLNQEKQALLDLYKGTEGEKSNLVAASQGALARASQLVSDAAAMREREALGTLDKIDKEMFKNLALRLEGLLPRNISGLEVSAIKGELLVSRIIDRGSKILDCIYVSLAKIIRPALAAEEGAIPTDFKIDLSDEVRQKFDLILFQTQFAQTIIEGSSELTRLLVAIQWPDLLPDKASAEISSIIYHSVGELDVLFGAILKSIKVEGELSPEHVSMGALHQVVSTTMTSLRGEMERTRAVLIPATWNPPGWSLMRDSSAAKFVCQGAAAALSLILSESGDPKTQQVLASTYEILEKTVAQASSACNRLCSLDIMNEKVVSELTSLADNWKRSSSVLVDDALCGLLSGSGMDPLAISADAVLQTMMKFSSTLRSANLVTNDSDEMFHAMSPEAEQSWEKLTALCRLVRSIDGDEDDINYIIRSRAIESRIAEAIENEEKLSLATVKIANLETSLAKKSTEVSLQTARLSELEKEIAKGSSMNVNRTFDLKSSDEFKRLSEENRVLQDAMQYWQSKAEEQDAAVNDMKSPAGKVSKHKMPSMMSPSAHGSAVARMEDIGLLEATLFRPALQQVLHDASRWKTTAMASHLQDLPPLHIPAISADKAKNIAGSLPELAAAQSNFRVVQASAKLVDLTNTTKSPRAQMFELNANYVAASERLQSVVARYSSILA